MPVCQDIVKFNKLRKGVKMYFSQAHIIFIISSFSLFIVATLICYKYNFPTDKVIKICFFLGLLSEISKIFSTMQIVPIVETVVENGALVYVNTGKFAPYIRSEFLPFYLCSLQILFLFLAIVVKNTKWKKRILSFIYCTALIGGVLAIFLSSIVSEFNNELEYLTSIRSWIFYLYHVMIMVIAMVIAHDKSIDIRFEDIKWSYIFLFILDIASLYLNSIFTVPLYNNGILMGITHASNYFSSYQNPLNIQMTNKNAYLIYMCIRFVGAVIIIALLYLPFLKRKKRTTKINKVRKGKN